ncbi:hypothetical protein E8E15_002438 [Penicillium rubens]|uniref:FHA domain-containing protein n=1 Tax=Penicillium chrysogenum TaxID=5076 RepID=A0A167SFF5_PENCH|nr:uncharacterized protein N7489_002601 [Penicillium chrysogenum]XP_061068996.1 uncharacterized protein N7525_008968 [Penicillium rubens]KAF3023802.1 hypothetical protein E8E15_002438 [Penicillium rubens]KAJ5047923.1 hypothetical protein NUH16_006420 [Penicillium rubens]KAJ5252191.1 hypothetical protein N7489_002601 [Penicillium chrysogenum]KAJ5830715.1 hypothetical protein N7525_008968 [Penicillium rubens]KZN87110.1 Uncharacterized protein EN45_056660 [Penicillium chrysogenum]
MSDPRVTVTLVPLFEDTHPLRTLTITDSDKTVAIGRASKREARKRIPAAENAWFESRVMSRDHAFLNIPSDQNVVFIADCGSTHGTFLNDSKLVTDVNTPLYSGDIVRFGVDVDRGQEVFEAIEVRCKVDWLRPQPVAIPDDDIAIKPDPSPSTNSFSVPEDESDMEAADNTSDVSSKESIARSWDNPAEQPVDMSLVSPVSSVQSDEHPKDEPGSAGSSPTEEPTTKVMPGPTTLASDLLSPLSGIKPVSDTQESLTEPASTELSYALQTHEAGALPRVCYQKVPEFDYSNWTIMRPMFMRLADMAWGESNTIPDVDHDRRIIHATRRCSLAKDAYWVDDSPTFRPCFGTEVYWEPDVDNSDTSFHRMPGSLLRYWSVDKRRYWIINENHAGQQMSNLCWIVEKPLEILSEELKQQLDTETEIDDCHKCWVVRAWKPQMVGNRWCDVAPYWDPNLNEDWLCDDESVDSDEEAQGNEGYVSESYGVSDYSISENYHDYPYGMFDSESTHGDGCEVWAEDFVEDDEEEDYDEDFEEEDYEVSDVSEDESECPSQNERLEHPISQRPDVHSFLSDYLKEFGRPNHTDAVEVSKHVPEPSGTLGKLLQRAREAESLNPAHNESKPLTTQTAAGMTNPGAQFPTCAVSGELPSSCQNKYRQMQCKIQSTADVPSSEELENFYVDGPFSNRATDERNKSWAKLKRSFAEMESSSVEPGFSQDAQRLPVEAASQPDSDLNTIAAEAKDAISSALAENDSAFAENERPAKRIKSNHPTSKSLASHATTAVVSALLGGLGTIAVLAALPNEYFQ